jgi:glycosyltransferase involved in cell wall biosynthesis
VEENITSDINPLVSIIIPCYNYKKYVEKSINSALAQTYKNTEIIVVDNGSTDNSLSIIQKFSSNKKVRILKFENNNPPGKKGSFHLNDAIKESKGEYISILYADDWYLPDKIKKQVDLFNSSCSSVGVVYCHGYGFIEKNNTKFKWAHQSVRGYIFNNYLKIGDVVIPISPLVKRCCYDIIGSDNPWAGTEYDYLVMSQYFDFDFVDEYLVVMRLHDYNDAKNIDSVYRRVIKFHNIVLLAKSAQQRASKFLINKRMARDYLTFGLDFIVRLDMVNAKDSVFRALTTHKFYIFKLKMWVCLALIFLPYSFSRYILEKTNKLSSIPINTCDW